MYIKKTTSQNKVWQKSCDNKHCLTPSLLFQMDKNWHPKLCLLDESCRLIGGCFALSKEWHIWNKQIHCFIQKKNAKMITRNNPLTASTRTPIPNQCCASILLKKKLIIGFTEMNNLYHQNQSKQVTPKSCTTYVQMNHGHACPHSELLLYVHKWAASEVGH